MTESSEVQSPFDSRPILPSGLLVDTWWYGLTRRMSAAQFHDLARQRAAEGFTAVQLVAGIPPEVGPNNENAASEAGPAWSLDGSFNQAYLELARQRVQTLNAAGLITIVYGAWGQQIAWLGRERMAAWWAELVRHLDDLEVIYCLTGESNLWIGQENRLLPDRTTGELGGWQPPNWLPGRVRLLGYQFLEAWARRPARVDPRQQTRRRADWSFVLETLNGRTNRPILVHPTYLETALQAVDNPQLLAANTTQTGHSEQARNLLWKLPLQAQRERPDWPFINLEPWYEGITNRFYAADQLYAYWVSMLGGATSFCYGAHGIWNVGDGRFLAHWGPQTFAAALRLPTPALIGRSHQFFLSLPPMAEVFTAQNGDKLLFISRRQGDQHITYFPDISLANEIPDGGIWLPLEGSEVSKVPPAGQVVIFNG